MSGSYFAAYVSLRAFAIETNEHNQISCKGAKNDQITAITLLGNAEFIVRMATTQQAANPQGGRGGIGLGGGMGMGLGGLELPTMMP